MSEVIPAVGPQKDFDIIKRRIDLVADLTSWIHIDVLDDTLVSGATYNHWEAFMLFHEQVDMEAHLMVSDPAKYVEPMVKNGFKRLIAHAEGDTVREFIDICRTHEVEVGLALDGPSAIDVIEPYLEEIDIALIMTITAGKSGQPFQAAQLPKIKNIHDAYSGLAIEVDGGIDKDSASQVVENGATRLAVTSYLFEKNLERLEEAIEELRAI